MDCTLNVNIQTLSSMLDIDPHVAILSYSEWSLNVYRLQLPLREGNVFTVCPQRRVGNITGIMA